MRYLPHTDSDRAAMLAAIGVKSADDLFVDVPAEARLAGPVAGLSATKSELEVERILSGMAAKNRPAGSQASFLGAGAYRHHVPASVDAIIQRGEFLTSYTPYQPEIAQGTLQYLFEFQTQVAMLTGMDVANASMYDAATAAVEAVQMANRVTRRGKTILSGAVHPHYRETIETHGKFSGFEVVSLAPNVDGLAGIEAKLDAKTASVVVQYPNVFGRLQDLTALAAACQKAGALLIVAIPEIVSMGAVTPPGDMGADIVVAEGQSIGNALNFGGPYVGLFAAKEKYLRQMPGRLCGETVDADGKRGWVLTLSTREQHIRREKATSNICTNSGLCALAFTVHLSLLGETGLRRLAGLNHALATTLEAKLAKVKGVKLLTDAYFNEFAIELPRDAGEIVDALADKGVLAGVPGSRLWPGDSSMAKTLIVAVTETNTVEDMDLFATKLAEVL
ncbi:MAG: aminomethyl-transferring glycine dehydrogenase subunit GcvPA [Alphaproteobacteria bacterium]|nr:aminomethyl-transferring glycine dehydrogenase subunit GcvPA [Alphaproteobacteria bacterium]